jgi:hypothetical protein
MKKTLAAVATLVVLAVPAVQAEEHLVSPGTAQQQLLDAAGTRERNVATIEAFVDSAEGSTALATVGLDPARVRAEIATLSDSELQDVAARASALGADPVAGLPFTQNRVVWIAAIAVAVIILIVLIA